MRTIAILLERADQTVPADLFKKIVEQGPNAFAYSIYGLSQAKEITSGSSTSDIPTPEQWNNVRTGQQFKSKRIITWWGLGKDIAEEDMQPRVLMADEKNRPLIVAYIDAKLEHLKETPTQFLDWMASEMSIIGIACNGDIKKIMEVCRTDAFQDKVISRLVNGGTIILHAIDDDTAVIRGEEGPDVDGEWGLCSNAYGWSEPESSKSVEPPAEPKQSSFLGSLQAMASGAASAVSSAVGTTSKDKLKSSAANTQELVDAAKAALVGGGSTTKVEMIFPPQDLVMAVKNAKNDKERKDNTRKLAGWYNDRCPKKDFSLDRDLKGWREGCGIPTAGSWKTAESFLGAFRRFTQASEGEKDTGTKHIPDEGTGPSVAEVTKKIHAAAGNNIFNTFADQSSVKAIKERPASDPVTYLAKLSRPADSPLKAIKMDDYLQFLSIPRDDLKLLSDQADWLLDVIQDLGHHYAQLLVDNLKLRAAGNQGSLATSTSIVQPTSEERSAIEQGAPVPKRERKRMF